MSWKRIATPPPARTQKTTAVYAHCYDCEAGERIRARRTPQENPPNAETDKSLSRPNSAAAADLA